MFSHLCRACLVHLNDETVEETVPLFEAFENVFYYRLCKELQLSLDENDMLSRNLCKSCADEVFKCYNFRLMYMESDRKLREMLLDRAIASDTFKPLVDVKLNIDEAGCIVQTSLNTCDSKWKCNQCEAGFRTRSLLCAHEKIHNPRRMVGKQNGSGLKGTSTFRSGQLKYQLDDGPSASIQFIEINDDEYASANYTYNGNETNDFPFVNAAEMDADENSSDPPDMNKFLCVQTEVGSYEFGNNEENDSFDEDDDNDSLLVEMKVSTDHPVQETPRFAGKWKCSACTESFRTRDMLVEHNKLHRKVKTEQQSLKAQTETKRSRNVKTYKQKNRWKCSICFQVFETRELLRIHRRTHLKITPPTINPKQWQCAFCPSVFLTFQEFHDHRQLEHPKLYIQAAEKKEWQCTYCLSMFASRRECRDHRRVEHPKIRRKSNINMKIKIEPTT